jgi:outer membrane protein TolC
VPSRIPAVRRNRKPFATTVLCMMTLASVFVAVPVAFAQTASSASPGSALAAGSPSEKMAPAAQKNMVRVTWRGALDRAAARNTSAVVAEQEIVRAQALVREARAAWLPILSANGTYTRINWTFDGMTTPSANLWNGNIQLTLPIISPVAWANDWHAQDNRASVTANSADVLRELATAVGRTYLTVLLQHRRLDVVGRARDNALSHYEYAHTRLDLGLGNALDDARSEQELRTDEAQLKDAETALVRAQSALAILLSDEDLVDASDEVVLGAGAGGAPDAMAAIDDARAHRADVRAAESRRAATLHLKRDEWVFYAPSLLAQAQAFKQTQTTLQAEKGWQAALVLSVPLYDGGLRYGVRKERQASDAESRAQLEGILRQVSVEVRTAFKVVANSDDSLRSAQSAAKAAATAATLADKAYRGGATTEIEVVDAQRRARDADSEVALAEDAARQARLDLLLATGAFP